MHPRSFTAIDYHSHHLSVPKQLCWTLSTEGSADFPALLLEILKGLCFLSKNLAQNHFSARSALQELLPVNILLTQLFYGMDIPILKQIELGKIGSLDHLSSLSPERCGECWGHSDLRQS